MEMRHEITQPLQPAPQSIQSAQGFPVLQPLSWFSSLRGFVYLHWWSSLGLGGEDTCYRNATTSGAGRNPPVVDGAVIQRVTLSCFISLCRWQSYRKDGGGEVSFNY
jgi:hypothetical protein